MAFIGDLPKFKKKIWHFENFNMSVYGNILKCAIF